MSYMVSLVENIWPFIALLGLNVFMFYMIRHTIKEEKNE